MDVDRDQRLDLRALALVQLVPREAHEALQELHIGAAPRKGSTVVTLHLYFILLLHPLHWDTPWGGLPLSSPPPPPQRAHSLSLYENPPPLARECTLVLRSCSAPQSPPTRCPIHPTQPRPP